MSDQVEGEGRVFVEGRLQVYYGLPWAKMHIWQTDGYILIPSAVMCGSFDLMKKYDGLIFKLETSQK